MTPRVSKRSALAARNGWLGARLGKGKAQLEVYSGPQVSSVAAYVLCIAGQLSNIGEHRAMIPLVSSCQTTVEAHKDTTKLSCYLWLKDLLWCPDWLHVPILLFHCEFIGTDTSLLQLSEPPEMFSVVPRIRLEDTLVAVREKHSSGVNNGD